MPSTTRSAEPGLQSGVSLRWLLLSAGALGWLASFVLTIEKFELATDPAYLPSCSINPVLNCGSVMSTPQAAVFGFPNSLLGIAGFAVLAATGAALLAGGRFREWYWAVMQVGVTAAAVFVHWLIVQSLYVIGALCPYCMIVWAATIPVFWYVTLRNLDRWIPPDRRPAVLDLVLTDHAVPLTVWALTVIALIAHRFWAYWVGII